MRLVDNGPDQLTDIGIDTESSVTIEIVRGARTIRVQEVFLGDDLVSEAETRQALNRMSEAIVQSL
jgi:uncharacterized protein YjiS (DUF1127 family)